MKSGTRWLPRMQVLWLLLALAAVVGFRASLFTWRPAVLLAAGSLAGLFLTGFGSLLILFARLRTGRQGGGVHCLAAVGLSLPVLLGVLFLGLQGAKAPPIHDITTDIDHPPPFRLAQALRRPGDNPTDYPKETAADRQRQAYPDIAPLEVALPPTEAFEAALAVAGRLGWRIVNENREEGLIEALDRTLLFGFIDDIVIRVSAAENGSRIDLRSASRAGVGDLGVNAGRIRSFVAAFPSTRSP